LGSALTCVDNQWCKHRARVDDLLCEPVAWAQIEYASLADTRVRGSGTLPITADRIAHGFLVWFDTVLADEVAFSNHPGAPEALYGQGFFRWPEPVALRRGDQVDFELRAD